MEEVQGGNASWEEEGEVIGSGIRRIIGRSMFFKERPQ